MTQQRIRQRTFPHQLRRMLFVLWFALLCLATNGAYATQHLVEPGRQWDDLAEICRPGDEIVLMPGVHKPATLANLTGSADKPIVICGIDEQHPAVFQNERIALKLVDPRHVVIENLVFERCELSAIVATVVPRHSANERIQYGERPGGLTVRNIRIDTTGPAPNARVIAANGLDTVRIEQTTIEGWSGRAIEFNGCTRVIVRDCMFRGVDQYEAERAIMLQGGTTESTIRNCWFINAGYTTAVSFGGESRLEQHPAVRNSADDKPFFEAVDCQVKSCIFVDQACPIMFSHAEDCAVRDSTFVRPKRWLCALLDVHDDERVAMTVRPAFANNLVTWDGGDLTGLFLVDGSTREVKLVLESNLWWSTKEPPAVRQRMIPTIVREPWPQVVNVNPQLDELHQPENSDASIFGARVR